ncbi:hypothetical protein [Tenacibaculum ovolyticum]
MEMSLTPEPNNPEPINLDPIKPDTGDDNPTTGGGGTGNQGGDGE